MQTQSVKTVGASGQISIGKEYSGRTVLIEKIEEGVWLIKTAQIIPDSERWIHEEPAKYRIRQAIAWAEENRPNKTDLEKLSAQIR
jgi:putative transposon-encoded protein